MARSRSQAALAERIGGLTGVVTDGETTIVPPDELIDLRNHPLQRDHWWGSAEFEAAYGPLSINEIVDRIGADFGIVADFTAPIPLEAETRTDADDLVLFIVDTDGTAKRWQPDRWLTIATALRRGGLNVAVVTRGVDSHPLVERGLGELVAATPGAAVDALSACRAVIGVDTGLTHIAVQQGTPTVTLSRTPAVYFRNWPHTRLVAGSNCDPACQRVEKSYAYNERVNLGSEHPAPRECPVGGHCLDAIEADMVMQAFEELC
jgi:ADP-heptose:LPS heptosyltransferase